LKRVGILTGGGDVPGLNAALKGFVWRMEESGYEVIGLRRGYAALLNVNPSRTADNSNWLMPLTRSNTRTIDRSGGTVLHSSRINPALTKLSGIPEHLRSHAPQPDADGRVDLTAATLEVLEFLRLDVLVAIGGDGTLSFARRLHHEGVKIIGLPKTMDNDVYGTDYCIGFSTAVTRSVNFINDLRTVAGSHERYLVVELFGRTLIAEVPFDAERVVEMMAEDKRTNPSNYAVAAISEGAYPEGGQPFESGEADAVGNRELGGVGRFLREALQKNTGDRVIYQRLGYLMRSGPPDSLDRLVANNFANLAADLILAGKSGRLASIQGGRYTTEPIEVTGEGKKQVNVERFYDRERYRPNIVGVMGLPMFLC
jgi:6-phosphofructokinase 1